MLHDKTAKYQPNLYFLIKFSNIIEGTFIHVLPPFYAFVHFEICQFISNMQWISFADTLQYMKNNSLLTYCCHKSLHTKSAQTSR